MRKSTQPFFFFVFVIVYVPLYAKVGLCVGFGAGAATEEEPGDLVYASKDHCPNRLVNVPPVAVPVANMAMYFPGTAPGDAVQPFAGATVAAGESPICGV
jgi:hypothetical protein